LPVNPTSCRQSTCFLNDKDYESDLTQG